MRPKPAWHRLAGFAPLLALLFLTGATPRVTVVPPQRPAPASFEFYYRAGPPSADDTPSLTLAGEFTADGVRVSYKSLRGKRVARSWAESLGADARARCMKAALSPISTEDDEYVTGGTFAFVKITYADGRSVEGRPAGADLWLGLARDLDTQRRGADPQ